LKPVPALGTVVLIGAVIQVILGFQVANAPEALLWVHISVGLVGLGLAIALALIAFRSRTATILSRAVMVILVLLVLLQVAFGFQILGGTETLTILHQGNGFLIVIVSLVMGAITFRAARSRTSSPT